MYRKICLAHVCTGTHTRVADPQKLPMCMWAGITDIILQCWHGDVLANAPGVLKLGLQRVSYKMDNSLGFFSGLYHRYLTIHRMQNCDVTKTLLTYRVIISSLWLNVTPI